MTRRKGPADRALELAIRTVDSVWNTSATYEDHVRAVRDALRDGRNLMTPYEPIKLWTPEEKQCWIAVYAQNSDNEEPTPAEIGRIADDAVLELRKRYST